MHVTGSTETHMRANSTSNGGSESGRKKEKGASKGVSRENKSKQ